MARRLGDPILLDCCCCGGGTRGRQWWNRDDGYGICDGCVQDCVKRGESAEEIERLYGKAGVHHSLNAAPKVET
jgi:hypothetical protein